MFLQEVHFSWKSHGHLSTTLHAMFGTCPCHPDRPIAGCSHLYQWPPSTVVTPHDFLSPQTPDLSTCLSITFSAICSPSAYPPSHGCLRRHPYFKMCVSGYLASWVVSTLPSTASARCPCYWQTPVSVRILIPSSLTHLHLHRKHLVLHNKYLEIRENSC